MTASPSPKRASMWALPSASAEPCCTWQRAPTASPSSPSRGTSPFTVVVFPDDLKTVGDIQQLEGRMVEIKGTIQGHDGRAEIVLRHTQQLGERVRRRSCGAQPTTTSNVGATTVRGSTAIPRPRRQLRSRAGRFQSRIPESPSSGRRSRSTRLTPIPCATRPADTSSPATRCHHSRAYRTSSAAICT